MLANAIIFFAIAASLLYLFATWTLAYTTHGVIRAGNPFGPQLAVFAGGVAFWLAALVAVGFGVRAVFRRRYSLVAASGVVATACFVSPLVAWSTLPTVFRHAELRDLKRADLPALRNEAASLVVANKTKDYPLRWFGGEVPPTDLPPAIRRLSTRAAYVTASDEGIVVVMDGLGGWRGGYMITPSNSSFAPPKSRQITEGVFYVTAQ